MISTSKKQSVERIILRTQKLSKNFGSVRALNRVDFSLRKGIFHVLIGEHGSGKSSLCKMISGLEKPTSGLIHTEFRTRNQMDIYTASNLGIQIVSQDYHLLDELSIADNFFLVKKSNKKIFYKKKHHSELVRKFLSSCGVIIDPNRIVKDLTSQQKVLLAILRHLYPEPKILILDEALEKLNPVHLGVIKKLLNQKKSEGLSILAVSHKIEEIYPLADRISVLRNGEIIYSGNVGNVNVIDIVRMAYTQTGTINEMPNRDFTKMFNFNLAIMNDLPMNIAVIDDQGFIRVMNNAAKKHFRIELDTTDELYIDNILYTNKENISRIHELLQKNKRGVLFDVPITLDNIITINNIYTLPIFRDGEKIGDLLIFNDITEQSKLREKIFINEKLSTIELFINGIAHEINNPLEILIQCLHYLQINIAEPIILETVQDMREEISSISKIVKSLKTLSPNTATDIEVLNLEEMINGVIRLVSHYSEEHGHRINFENNFKNVYVECNGAELRQVFINLIKNSFEAMQENGRINITINPNPDNRNKLMIVFEDTGTGFTDENINDVFLPFYSMSKKQKTDSNMGLGLYMCHTIIKKYKGRIWAENNMPFGAKIIINLPYVNGANSRGTRIPIA